MDALYIHGMLNNPDLQPNMTINQWIAAILLFNFKLVHVLAEKHHGPDSLSHREPVEGEDEDKDDPEDWIGCMPTLGLWVVSWLDLALTNKSVTTWMLDSQDGPLPRRGSCLHAKANINNSTYEDNSCNSSQHSDSLEHLADILPFSNNNTNGNSDNHNSGNLPSLDGDLDNSPKATDTTKTSSTNHDADTHTAPSTFPFPQNEKTIQADDELMLIRHYLSDPHPPSNLHGDMLTCFVCRTTRFALANGHLWRWQPDRCHQLCIMPPLRFSLVHNAHDGLGHKGFYSTCRTLLNRFWWPLLDSNVKWYVDTCHQCQLHQTVQVHIPPTIASPVPLFCKVYIDTMFMPLALGFCYIVQAQCSLTTWPEWRTLQTETGHTLGTFIFEEILYRWGAVEQIVTDNGTAYIVALDWLSSRYGICHIHILAYNLRANGIVE